MATKNITDIEELDSFWKSKFQRLKNTHSKAFGALQAKTAKLHERAKVDYKFNQLVRERYPEVHIAIYAELSRLGINTKGIIRKASSPKPGKA